MSDIDIEEINSANKDIENEIKNIFNKDDKNEELKEEKFFQSKESLALYTESKHEMYDVNNIIIIF